jgi:hypothetical protein
MAQGLEAIKNSLLLLVSFNCGVSIADKMGRKSWSLDFQRKQL